MQELKTSIFFHMGPGLHSQVEAAQFEKLYPHVLFIDQPQNMNFSDLKYWAQDIIRAQHALSKSKLTLLGHSFGSQVAAAALPGVQDLIEEVRFLNSPFHSFASFTSLEEEMFPDAALGYEGWKDKSVDEKMVLIFRLSADLRLTSHYWRCPETRLRHEALSNTKPPLNVGSFLKAYMEYLNTPELNISWAGKATILYSLDDALVRSHQSVQGWKNIYPNVNYIEIKSGGHYLHFESSEVAEIFFKK